MGILFLKILVEDLFGMIMIIKYILLDKISLIMKNSI